MKLTNLIKSLIIVTFLLILSCTKKSSSITASTNDNSSTSPETTTPVSTTPSTTTSPTTTPLFSIGYDFGFYHPVAIHYYSDNSFLILDNSHYYFKKFDANKNLLGSYVTDGDGSKGTISYLSYEYIAGDFKVDSSGNIYLLTDRRVIVYDSQFNFLRSIDISNEVSIATSLEIDLTNNHLFISDADYSQIHVYNLTTGAFQQSLGTGTATSASDDFNYPMDLLIYNNHLYVLDDGNHSIKSIDLTNFSSIIEEYNLNSSQQFISFSVNSAGLFSVLSYDGVLERHTTSTTSSRTLSFAYSLYFTSQITNDPSDNLIIPTKSNLYKMPSGISSSTYEIVFSNSNSEVIFSSPSRIAVNANDNSICSIENNSTSVIQCFTASGTLTWATEPVSSSSYSYLQDLTFDQSNNLLVAKQGKILKYDSTGQYLGYVISGTTVGQSGGSLKVSSDNFIYFYNVAFGRVYKYNNTASTSSSQSPITSFSANYYSSENGISAGIYKLDLDSANNIYIFKQNKINVYTSAGVSITQLTSPSQIASGNAFGIDSQDRMWIVDTSSSRTESYIYAYTTSGTLITSSTISKSLTTENRLNQVYGVAFNSDDQLMTVDNALNRILKFDINDF